MRVMITVYVVESIKQNPLKVTLFLSQKVKSVFDLFWMAIYVFKILGFNVSVFERSNQTFNINIWATEII